jgi:hypothetical protein
MRNRLPGRIRLMGQSRNNSDIAGARDIRTASSMFMTRDERESLESAMDFRALGPEARRERDKFARQDAAVEKFRENYFRARERLAATINKNRALMRLRHELQRRRRMGEDPQLEGGNATEAKAPTSQEGLSEIEVRY